MKATTKANQLIDNFIVAGCLFANAKKCALIAVEEIIKSRPAIPSPKPCNSEYEATIQAIEYWNLVKSELNKL